MRHGFDPVMEAMFAAAKDLCACSDAVVGHFLIFPLRVAAEKSGIPMATLNVVHNCLPSSFIRPPGLPDFGRWSYGLGWKVVRMMVNRIFLPRVNALREKEGLFPERDVMTQTWASERLNLVAVSPSICGTPSDWGTKNKVRGFLNPPTGPNVEGLPAGLSDFLAAGEPPVYFTFGSMMIHDLPYLKEAAGLWMTTVRKVGCRAVFQLPWSDLSVFGADNRVFMVRRAPYKQVFPKCALVVHHGGAGTTQSALFAGCPSVVVAHMSDQFFWGSELERLGVAGPTQMRKGLSSRGLAKAIALVLACPDMRKRASAIGMAMVKENGVEVAVGLIEAHLTGTHSVT